MYKKYWSMTSKGVKKVCKDSARWFDRIGGIAEFPAAGTSYYSVTRLPATNSSHGTRHVLIYQSLVFLFRRYRDSNGGRPIDRVNFLRCRSLPRPAATIRYI